MNKLFTLLSFCIVPILAHGQIPNAGFETWTTVSGYNTPTSWDNPNSITSVASIYTCDSGMDAAPEGLAYLKLTTKTIAPLGDIPGVAVTGQISISGTSYTVNGGFVQTTRPVSLTGKWQHMGAGSDHARLGAFLWKWNTALSKRDTVAFKDSTLTGSATSWQSFTLPLDYVSGETPDSAIVVLSSSASSTSATANSYLWVDDLAFTGSVPAGVISVTAVPSSSVLFPNPASSAVSVYYHSKSAGAVEIQMTDLTGKTIISKYEKAVPGENSFELNLKPASQGIYIVRILDEGVVVARSRLFID